MSHTSPRAPLRQYPKSPRRASYRGISKRPTDTDSDGPRGHFSCFRFGKRNVTRNRGPNTAQGRKTALGAAEGPRITGCNQRYSKAHAVQSEQDEEPQTPCTSEGGSTGRSEQFHCAGSLRWVGAGGWLKAWGTLWVSPSGLRLATGGWRQLFAHEGGRSARLSHAPATDLHASRSDLHVDMILVSGAQDLPRAGHVDVV